MCSPMKSCSYFGTLLQHCFVVPRKYCYTPGRGKIVPRNLNK